MAAAKPRAPRTAPGLRREQLIEAAVPEFAELGYEGVQLRGIADRVGVTRNLIHHYFPGGKRDLYVEAVRAACHELAALLDISSDLPLAEKTPANVATLLDAVLEPDPVYVLYARAGRSADEDIRALALEMRDMLSARIAINNYGTAEPPAATIAALHGFIAFTEATCESWRERGLDDRPALETTISEVFARVVEVARPG